MSNPCRQQSQAQADALDRAYRAERRRIWARNTPLVLIAGALVAAFIWVMTSRGGIVEHNVLDATVLNWSRSQDYVGSSTLLLTVKLATGRQVTVSSNQSLAPKSGAQIKVQENIYENGGRAFIWPVNALRQQ